MTQATRKPRAKVQSVLPQKLTMLRIPRKIILEVDSLLGREPNIIFSLPAEILDQVFYRLDYTERWCFALSCKAAARYAANNPTFLEIPAPTSARTFRVCSTPRTTSGRPGRVCSWRYLNTLADSQAHNDIMRTLSIGWADKALHWCDHCGSFRSFPAQTRWEWYGGQGVRVTVEAMRRGGGWVQDIGLSVEGLICWNHACPPCARAWWNSVSNGMVSLGEQVAGSKRGS